MLNASDCRHISGCGTSSCRPYGTCIPVGGSAAGQVGVGAGVGVGVGGGVGTGAGSRESEGTCVCQTTHFGQNCQGVIPVLTPADGSWVKVRIEAGGMVYLLWSHDYAHVNASWSLVIQVFYYFYICYMCPDTSIYLLRECELVACDPGFLVP